MWLHQMTRYRYADTHPPSAALCDLCSLFNDFLYICLFYNTPWLSVTLCLQSHKFKAESLLISLALWRVNPPLCSTIQKWPTLSQNLWWPPVALHSPQELIMTPQRHGDIATFCLLHPSVVLLHLSVFEWVVRLQGTYRRWPEWHSIWHFGTIM